MRGIGADRGRNRPQAKALVGPSGSGVLRRSSPALWLGAGLHPELAAAGRINIAQGRMRESLPEAAFDALAGFLARQIVVTFGRTSTGGLTKFEPRDMERCSFPISRS